MIAKTCKQCGAPLPLPSGRGRPRTRCELCAPSVKRTPVPVPTVTASGGVTAAARAELQAAGTVDTTAGQAALRIAAAVDSGEEHGASLAALVKQLNATMVVAVGKSEPDADPIQQLRDELAARRDGRSA